MTAMSPRGDGSIPVFNPIQANRAPTTSDTIAPDGSPFQPGQSWVDQSVGQPYDIYYYAGGGNWTANQLTLNTDDTFAAASNSTASSSLAIKTYVDNTTTAGAPVATEAVAGIGQLATNAEAVAGTPSTGALALFVTPSNLASVMAAPGAIGGTTAAAGTFTDLTADGAGAVSLTGNAASTLTNTAGDLTVDSQAGSLILDSGEAAADAVKIIASNAAGGIDMDAGTAGIAIDSTDAISIDAAAASNFSCSAGDMTIDSAAGSLILTSGENVADSIVISADAGGIDILAPAGAAGQDIDIINTGGSVNISASEGVSDAINIDASAGGMDVDVAGQLNLTSSQNAADAVVILSSAGGVDITATGTAGEDLDLLASGSSVNITATENAAQAIYIRANGGTSETVDIHADQGTGVASINVHSDVGGVTIASGLASADAININASGAAGGIDIDSGTAGVIVDSTGAVSLDAAAASNFSVTGAGIDLTLESASGRVIMNGEEASANALTLLSAAGGLDANVALQMNLDSSQAAAADSVRIVASAADGGMDLDAGTGGMTLDSTGAISVDAAAASNFSVSGAGIDLTLASAAGRVIVDGGEAAVNAITLDASDAAGGIDVNAGTGGITVDSGNAISLDAAAASNFSTSAGDLTIDSAAGSLILSSGEDVADSIQIVADAGGIDITASAGAAGQDIDITNTGGSVKITASESVTDAIVINASGEEGGVDISAGTNGIALSSGQIVNVVSKANADTPYALLGTDYVVAGDTSAGVLTVTLPASPATGRVFIVTDKAGNAAASNITVDGNGKNIAAAGTAAGTKVIDSAYGSMYLVYTGALWNAFDLP